MTEMIPWSAIPIDTPKERTIRDLSLYLDTIPDKDIGFMGRMRRSLSGETVTGELFREWNAPDFTPTNYIPSKEDIEKYASDLPAYTVQRVVDTSRSLPEFLYELDQVRLTNKRREEIFSGGTLGTISGFGSILLAAGGEAAALTLLGGTALSAMRGAGAAVSATGAISKAQRVRGSLKAMGIASAVDIPLEMTRMHLDKSLRPMDLMIALGASAGISGAIGAVKPNWFLRELNNMSNTAKVKEAADMVRESGAEKLADEIDAKVNPRPTTSAFTKQHDEIISMPRKELFAEAKRLGVKTHKTATKGFRSADDIRKDVIKKRLEDESPLKQSIRSEVEGMSKADLQKTAAELGIPVRIKGRFRSAKSIKEDVTNARTQREINNPLYKSEDEIAAMSTKDLRVAATEAGIPTRIKGKFRKSADVRSDLIKSAKAKQALPPTKSTAARQSEIQYKNETESMVEEMYRKEPLSSKGEESTHPMDGPESVVTDADGNPIAVGPSEFVEVDYDAIPTPSRTTVFEKGQGVRETIARMIEVFGGKFFMGAAHRLRRSDSKFIREMNKIFFESAREGGENATTAFSVNVSRMVVPLKMKLNAARLAAREAGHTLNDIDIVRALRGGETPEGPLGDAVTAIRQFTKSVLNYGKKNGLFDETLEESDIYFHRSYNSTKFRELIEELGDTNVVNLFANAILKHKNSVAKKMTLAQAKRIASRIVEYGSDPSAYRDFKSTAAAISRMRDKIISEIQEQAKAAGKSVSKSEAETEAGAILDAIVPRLDRQPHMPYARRRIEMDENHSEVINGRTVHIDDFLNNNVDETLTRYAQKVIGGSEIRKGLKRLFRDSDVDVDALSIEEILKRIGNEARKSGESESFPKDLFEFMYKQMTGQQVYSDAKTMRRIMGVNAFASATIGTTLGFASIVEIANIVAQTGFRAAFQQMPSLKEMYTIFTVGFRDLKTGRQGLGMTSLEDMDDFTSVLSTFTGVSADYTTGSHLMRRLDDMGFDSDYIQGMGYRALEYGRLASALNPLGVMPMDIFLRRWAVRASHQHFVNQAYKVGADGTISLNSGFWKNSKVRFEQLGLSESDINRLSKALRDPELVTVEPGVLGRYRVKSMDTSKIKDQYIMDKFALALRRHSDLMIQRNSLGETPFWMHSKVGKLIGQYRVFMMVAKSKQLAAGVARLDSHQVVNFMGACAIGSLVYQIQTHYRSLGMSEKDRREYLAKRLTEENIMRAGVMRNGASSIFPMLADSMAWMLGADPVFDPSMRTTGLGVDPIMGSVPMNIYDKKLKPAFRELTGWLFRDDPVSQQDARTFQSLVIGARLPFFEQIIQRLFINQLPEKD